MIDVQWKIMISISYAGYVSYDDHENEETNCAGPYGALRSNSSVLQVGILMKYGVYMLQSAHGPHNLHSRVAYGAEQDKKPAPGKINQSPSGLSFVESNLKSCK